MLNRLISGAPGRLTLLSLCVLATSGCAPNSLPSGPPEYFEMLIRAQTMDANAVTECERIYPGLQSERQNGVLVAAVNSTAGEIRALATHDGIVSGHAEGLPLRDDTFMAICILDTSENAGVRPVVGMALWAGSDDTVNVGPAGGSGVISGWTAD